jgi:hypothetical protein
MVSEDRIKTQAERFRKYEAEGETESGVGSDFGIRAWAFMLRSLTDEEFVQIETKPDDFLFEDNSTDPLWEKCQESINFWEEWSYGEVLERIAGECDDKHLLSDPSVWEVLLNRVPITKPDYEFSLALLNTGDNELCYDFFQGHDYTAFDDHPRAAEYRAIVPGYDPEAFYKGLDRIYTEFEKNGVNQDIISNLY